MTQNNNSRQWERSQAALNLEQPRNSFDNDSDSPLDYVDEGMGAVSEHSKVYWDLSQATINEDEEGDAHGEAAMNNSSHVKISLSTIRKGDSRVMTSTTQPRMRIQTRVIRRMSSETALLGNSKDPRHVDEYTEYTLPPPPIEGNVETVETSHSVKEKRFSFGSAASGETTNLTVTLAQAIPVMQEDIEMLAAADAADREAALDEILDMIESAWATPTVGRDLAYGLCDVLRNEGGLHTLLTKCSRRNETSYTERLGCVRILEQSMTVNNRAVVAEEGLESIVSLASESKDDVAMTKALTGVLEALFKHSEDTCTNVVREGGLDSILYTCRSADTRTLRHCATALANLAIYGGADNQYEMITRRAPDWLFPLAFSNDDSIRYYAFLAIVTLSANKELAAAVKQSGTLELVKPFIMHHDPATFASSDSAHVHGQSKEWLRRLVPLLDSRQEEAQALAAFHFAMEAGIKTRAGQREVLFREIGAVDPLTRLASGTNRLAAKFAGQALRILGEAVPYKLTDQVPLWTVTDVKHWLQQVGFPELVNLFVECQVDGDVLLLLTEEQLINDLDMKNSITRHRFMRELRQLKLKADYSSCDHTKVHDWLQGVSKDLTQYTYQLVEGGVDRKILRSIGDDHYLHDCQIVNGVHRLKLLEASKQMPVSESLMSGLTSADSLDRQIDCFISYRRSTGSQLASLLKVHLQLRGYTVFLDIDKLRAGKFDDNLLNSVRGAKHFILILTEKSLDRCIGDKDMKDWVHREIVAAIEGGCNIIPVMDNFVWPVPESLPDDMRPVCFFNGISWVHDYQDACVEKLEEFLNPSLTSRKQRGYGTQMSSGSVHGCGAGPDAGSGASDTGSQKNTSG